VLPEKNLKSTFRNDIILIQEYFYVNYYVQREKQLINDKCVVLARATSETIRKKQTNEQRFHPILKDCVWKA